MKFPGLISHLNLDHLTKFTVGQSFTVQAQSDSSVTRLELYTNLNNSHQTLPFNKSATGFDLILNFANSGFFKWHIRFQTENSSWIWLRDQESKKISGLFQVDPTWINKAIVYSVFVRFFKGRVPAQVSRQPSVYKQTGLSSQEIKTKSLNRSTAILPGEGGTFDDVKAYLDELSKMHVNVLYFNPIHKIGQLFRGYNMLDQLPGYLQPGSPYSIQDYKSIDPELTYDKDTKKHLLSDPQQEFKDLIDAAHQRGMHVIMDLVFNHTAHDFVFQRIRPEWYLYKENITDPNSPYLYPEDLKDGKPWGDPAHSVPPYDHGIFWEDCAQLNWEYLIPEASNSPPKNQYLKEMWEYLKSVPKYWVQHFGIDGFRCDVAYRIPPAFWKACIAETRELARNLRSNLASDVVFIAESYTTDLDVLQSAGFSAVYGDFSHKLNRPNTLKGYLDYIYNLDQPTFPPGSRWCNFPDSHDFDRAPIKVLGSVEDSTLALRANQSRWLLTCTLPGIPMLFNGFEKIEWQPINIWSYGAIDWEKDLDLRNFIAKINRLRHLHPALIHGDYQWLPTSQDLSDSTQLFAFTRTTPQETLIIVCNMDVYHQAGPAKIFLPDDLASKPYTLTDLLTQQQYQRDSSELTVILNPGESHLFQFSTLS